jgi:hypothetical protein
MTRFTYSDIVKLKDGSAAKPDQSGRAWVIAILTDRTRFPLPHLPPGVVYSIEFEDGSAVDVHEDDLEPWPE